MKFPIVDQLSRLKEEGRLPFHMPGHKRKLQDIFSDVCSMDITEITDYDNLHHPEGMILESMEMVKEIYHTKKSWYLINGSTVGILSAISALCDPGDSILVARNCHKAVYNAVRLLHLKPIYFYPDYEETYDMMQGITKKDEKRLEQILCAHPGIKAMILTSPTYEGIVSDVAAVKEALSRYAVPLIVDEAHGAHFVFHEYFPKSAVECGADIVIQSAHKTLPAFTQTALLHLCTDRIPVEKVEEMLGIYETSSPSYLLLASTEYGVLYTQNHPDKVQEYVDNLKKFREKCAQFQKIHLLEKDEVRGCDYDFGKLVFVVKQSGISGKDLFERMLREYRIEFEMETAFYCIAMTSIADEWEDFARLFAALEAVDQELVQAERDYISREKKEEITLFAAKPEQKMFVWEAMGQEQEEISLEEAENRIVAEYIYLYPPGIPILVPGEKIEKEIVENIRYYLYNGYNVPALSKHKIRVLKEME